MVVDNLVVEEFYFSKSKKLSFASLKTYICKIWQDRLKEPTEI